MASARDILRRIAIAAMTTLAIVSSGCRSEPEEVDDAPPPEVEEVIEHRPDVQPEISDAAYDGPPALVRMMGGERTIDVVISVQAPTGGWRFTLDKGEVRGGQARLYATLERPAGEELVTQALETKSRTWSTRSPVDRAVLLIRQIERGDPAPGEIYVVAARFP